MLRPSSGRFRFVFGYGPADALTEGVPRLGDASELAALTARYRATVSETASVRALAVEDVLALRTTWASKLGFSGHARRFVEVTGDER